MTSRDPDRDTPDQTPRAPWHRRTSTVLGASAAALAAIAVLVASVGYLTGRFAEPEQAPVDYVGPPPSATSPRWSTPTTATAPATITETTSTRPPITSDINPDLTPSSTPSSTGAAEASTLNPQTTTRPPNYRPPRTRDNDDGEQITGGRPTRSPNPVP